VSSLKVDNITGRGSTGFTGSVKSEGGNTTTDLQQGLCKAWVNYLTASTFVNNDSFNVASITDEGAGQAFHNFTNAMANAVYSYVGMCNEVSAGASLTAKSTSGCRQFSYSGTPSAVDTTENSTVVNGDLA